MKYAILTVLIAALAAPGLAKDIYMIGVEAAGAPINPCVYQFWQSNVLFHNGTHAPQMIRLLGVSNGIIDAPFREFVIAAGASTSLEWENVKWRPIAVGEDNLWIWKLDVPEGVDTNTYLELRAVDCEFHDMATSLGQITLPEFTALKPADEEQVFLGTDLGLMDRRVNVAIYNAGTEAAVADVTVHRMCDDATIASATITIPANTTIQAVRLASGAVGYTACGPEGRGRGTYVSVTVSQPSIAFVSAISNETIPKLTHNFIGD